MLLWDARTELEANEAKMLEDIINKNRHKESYYIFKHSNWTGNDLNVMKTTYMLRSSKPPKILGTILWLVDNTKGTLEKIWDLPLDVIVPTEYLDTDSVNEHIAQSAKDIKEAVVLS